MSLEKCDIGGIIRGVGGYAAERLSSYGICWEVQCVEFYGEGVIEGSLLSGNCV